MIRVSSAAVPELIVRRSTFRGTGVRFPSLITARTTRG
jgi:hypothetical protein